MKQACQSFSRFFVMLALFAPVTLLAQTEEKEKESKEKKEAEQIIITRKGDKETKVVVEINGDKVTVNGKDINDLKDDNITVRRNKIRDVWAYADGLRGSTTYAPGTQFRMLSVDSNRALLGVTTEKAEKGVIIQEVSENSAAAKAGLKEGDEILKVGDKKIETPDDLSAAIKAQKPGDKISVTYLRDKKEQKTTAELGRWKAGKVASGHNFNIDLGDLNKFNMDMNDLNMTDVMPRVQPAPRFKIRDGQGYSYNSGGPRLGLSVQDTDDGKGVKVLEVDDESNAAKAGLKEDDLITEVNGKAVNSADEVAKIIRESKDKPSVQVKYQRGGKTNSVEVKIPKKLKTADL